MSKLSRLAHSQLVSILVWAFSLAVAVGDLLALHRILVTIIALVIPIDPLARVTSKYRAAALERWGLVGIALVWLAGVVFLLSYYPRQARKAVLFRRFAVVTLLQLAVIAIGCLLPRILLVL